MRNKRNTIVDDIDEQFSFTCRCRICGAEYKTYRMDQCTCGHRECKKLWQYYGDMAVNSGKYLPWLKMAKHYQNDHHAEIIYYLLRIGMRQANGEMAYDEAEYRDLQEFKSGQRYKRKGE